MVYVTLSVCVVCSALWRLDALCGTREAQDHPGQGHEARAATAIDVRPDPTRVPMIPQSHCLSVWTVSAVSTVSLRYVFLHTLAPSSELLWVLFYSILLSLRRQSAACRVPFPSILSYLHSFNNMSIMVFNSYISTSVRLQMSFAPSLSFIS